MYIRDQANPGISPVNQWSRRSLRKSSPSSSTSLQTLRRRSHTRTSIILVDPMLVLWLLMICAIRADAWNERDGTRNVKDYVLDKPPVERQLFHLKRNGFKVDVRVVPSYGNESARGDKDETDDHFPAFPVGDIGKCIIDFSLGCIRTRFVRFLETIGSLDEITLLGQDVKLIKSRSQVRRSDSARGMNDSDVSIGDTVDDFFDSFTLRITLPRWNGKREKNRIDVMLDETAVAEGRKKGGGGGGGGGCGGKGGKCKMMMMGMMMMIKMKLLTLGLLAFKGMMMGGVSMMMLLMQKFGKGGGGGGPWQGGGGGQLKEIVLLTKSSGGGGHGGGGAGCCGPSDSYGAPPSSSYSLPSGGGGGYGGGGGGGSSYGGGGWGRSFHKRPMTLSRDETTRTVTAGGSNRTLMIGEATAGTENIDYPDYQDYQEPSPIAHSNLTAPQWDATSNNNVAYYEYGGNQVNVNSVRNDSKLEWATKGRSIALNKNPSNTKTDIGNGSGVDLMTSTNEFDSRENANLAYTDEWQVTAGKLHPGDVSSPKANARAELRRVESRSRDVPLLRGI